MTPEAKQLLKDKPELCKEIAYKFMVFYDSAQHKSGVIGESIWEMFLKEQRKPDWEILSFRDTSHSFIKYYLQENGMYRDNVDDDSDEFSLSDILSGDYSVRDGMIAIHSVRRSDGEVFEVGDKVRDSLTDTLTNNAIQEISAFMHGFCPNGTEYLTVSFKSGTTAGIGSLTKLKPLFKTEDGVDIYEEEKYCFFFEEMLHDAKAYITDPYQPDVKRFSTREAAEAWVRDNKTTLNAQSIAEVLSKAGITAEDIINSLKK